MTQAKSAMSAATRMAPRILYMVSCPLPTADGSGSGPCAAQGPEKLERPTGFEPATSSLGSWHSATELRPLAAPYITPELPDKSARPRNEGGPAGRGAGGTERETRVSGTASVPAVNRCSLTGAG